MQTRWHQPLHNHAITDYFHARTHPVWYQCEHGRSPIYCPNLFSPTRLTHPPTHSPTHSLTSTYSLTHTLPHPLIHPLTHSHTHFHSLTHSPTHSSTHSLPLTHSLTRPPSLPPSNTHTHTRYQLRMLETVARKQATPRGRRWGASSGLSARKQSRIRAGSRSPVPG